MSSKYEGMSETDADDLMRGTIGGIVCEALNEARRMTRKEWNDRDIFEWSNYIAGLIAVIVENRRRNAPQ
ncbi:hypothetical protein ATCR1_21315 [Agrobacterium tumefaciens CCNWGS0286]|uniref:hypothetical protein n=1 Tax=Agrobacterium tumefaciens TaxID=358 RepID=UPI0002334BE8|nr:hypothetical protein [Agrobacterium tumefaciens]EHH03363.1 hypothetical protein ATCR1_21315 [Agrobacterium tumefaciens CCNWGS0286]